ncbi:hypothetical protein D3C87_1607930 [compost metagenome]
MAKILEFVKKLVPRRITARRLQDEGGYAAWKTVKQTARTGQIIIAEAKDQILDRLRNARIHLRCSDEPVVGGEKGVVAAARDQVAAGNSPRKSYRSGCRIGTVLAEFDHFGRLDRIEKGRCAIHLDL